MNEAADDLNEWVRGFQAGRKETFEMIYRHFFPRLQGFLRRRLGARGDSPDLEDLLQEIFMKIHRSLGSFRFESGVSTWMYQIAVNHLRDRKIKHELSLGTSELGMNESTKPLENLAAPGISADESLHRKEIFEILEKTLAALSKNERNVWLLNETEGFSLPEVAAMLGLPLRTTQTIKEKSSRHLRLALAEKGIVSGGIT